MCVCVCVCVQACVVVCVCLNDISVPTGGTNDTGCCPPPPLPPHVVWHPPLVHAVVIAPVSTLFHGSDSEDALCLAPLHMLYVLCCVVQVGQCSHEVHGSCLRGWVGLGAEWWELVCGLLFWEYKCTINRT